MNRFAAAACATEERDSPECSLRVGLCCHEEGVLWFSLLAGMPHMHRGRLQLRLVQAAVARLVHLIDLRHQEPLCDLMYDDYQDELW
jgi:hypothetical protein